MVVYARTKSAYETFCSPECYKAIKEYLDLRQRFGEILKPQSALFRNDFDPENLDQVKHAKPLSHDAIKSKIRSLLIRTGVGKYQKLDDKNTAGRRRNEVQAAHGFRKTAYTQMGRSRMDPEIRELLVGHRIGVRASYLKYSEEDKLNEYLRAVDNLTIDPASRLQKEVDEYKQQQRHIEELEKEMKAIKEEQIEGKEYFRSTD